MPTKRGTHNPTAAGDDVASTGDVFADLGLPDSDELLMKAKLLEAVATLIRRRGWTQRRAATALGITQPEVSAILNGKLRGFSIARLVRSLKALGAGRVSVHVELEGEPELIVAV